MTEETDPRRKYLEEYTGAVDRHRTRAFEYEVKAIDYSNAAFRVLTYLNGGALVAIPTAVALFQTDPAAVKYQLVAAAAMYVASLIFIIGAQSAAFFTMARRSEAETYFQYEQHLILHLRYYIKDDDVARASTIKESTGQRQMALDKIQASNSWRRAGIVFFWLSLILFIGGSIYGGKAVLGPM